MKTQYYIYIMLLLLIGACKKDKSVEIPVFGVTTESNTYAVGEDVKFNFTGNPDMISFYSGEVLHDYDFRGGRTVEPGKLTLSFYSNVQYGYQANQLSVFASTDFNGNYSFTNGIFDATWQDITSRFILATNSTFIPSGNVDVSDLRVEGKPLYFAFKYNVRNQAEIAAGGYRAGRTWKIQNFNLTSETSIGTVILADMASVGFRLIDLKPDIAPMRSTVTSQLLTMVAHSYSAPYQDRLTIETENWAITKAFETGKQDLGPDRPVAVKGIEDGEIATFTHKFSKPGTYKVYFSAINANIYDQRETLREVDLTITP